MASVLSDVDPSYSGIAAAAAQDGRDYIAQRMQEIAAESARRAAAPTTAAAPAPVVVTPGFNTSSPENKVIAPTVPAVAQVMDDPWGGGMPTPKPPAGMRLSYDVMTGPMPPGRAMVGDLMTGPMPPGLVEPGDLMMGSMPDPALTGRASLLPPTPAAPAAAMRGRDPRSPRAISFTRRGGAPAAPAPAPAGDGRTPLSVLENDVPWDFGIYQGMDKVAGKSQEWLASKGLPRFGGGVAKGLRLAGRGLSIAPWAALAAAPVLGGIQGYQEAGTGGAVLQGGGSALGTVAGTVIGGFAGGPIGAMIGGTLGNMAGDALGGGLTQLGRAGMDARAAGDTGVMGAIGMAGEANGLETEARAAQREFDKMQNSPQMRAMREQQKTERLQREADLLQQMYYQSLMN